MTLYHTTINADKVLAEGFRTPKELERVCSGIGQAECTEKMLDTISMTANPQMAEAFAEDLTFLSQIAKGNITEQNMCEYIDKKHADIVPKTTTPCKVWQSLAFRYVRKNSWRLVLLSS